MQLVLAPKFLRMNVSKEFVEVVGGRVHCGAEAIGWISIVCVGPPTYIERMKELVDFLVAAEHLASYHHYQN